MISVVIPAYNEEKQLGKCLDSLVKQNTTKKFEVLVVNNNSTDKTEQIAKEFNKKLFIRLLLQKEKGRGAARYLGFQHAKGDIVLSTDADTSVPPDWIEKLTDYLEKNKAVAVTGTCKIIDCSNATNISFNLLQPFIMRMYRFFFGHYWLSGFNFAIYKEAYLLTGGFNPKLNMQEDIDLSFRVSKIGKIRFISNLPVIFSGRRFQRGLLKGLVPYVTTFIAYFVFKRENVTLSDIR